MALEKYRVKKEEEGKNVKIKDWKYIDINRKNTEMMPSHFR